MSLCKSEMTALEASSSNSHSVINSQSPALKAFQDHLIRLKRAWKQSGVTLLANFWLKTLIGSCGSHSRRWLDEPSLVTSLYNSWGSWPALTSVPLLDFLDDLKWNKIWSSVVTWAWPEEPQSLDGPETLAHATYLKNNSSLNVNFLKYLNFYSIKHNSFDGDSPGNEMGPIFVLLYSVLWYCRVHKEFAFKIASWVVSTKRAIIHWNIEHEWPKAISV